MINFRRGDVVLVDLGMAAKVRPCVVVSMPSPDTRRNMSLVVPMTIEIRGGECEIPFAKPPWLKQSSVVNLAGIAGVDNTRIERQLARIPADKMDEISPGLTRMLDLKK